VSEWISVKGRYPEANQKVWYFFNILGVHKGQFYGFEPCYEGMPDDEEYQYSKCKLPNCGLDKNCTGIDVFGGDSGVLSGDVTHWMPDTGQEKPEPPSLDKDIK